MAHCLNPRVEGGHPNPENATTCQRCDFLVQGARIGIYEVESYIGAGSYGYVYQVREPAPLSRILALKVLRFDQFNEKALSNFFDEARRIASLQYPHILPVYNFGQLEDGRPYLVMEYAPRTILDVFKREDGTRRLALAEELIPYIQQSAEALHYLHSNGLIHQDVKPGNLLIGRNGQLLLSDFGATFYLGMQTHASLGEVTGTATYMPPEQWQGNPRRDSDQYALAICCYELLAGRPPFSYKRIEEMWNAHLKEPAPSPQKFNSRVPVEVSAVLQRAIAKDYRQRYVTILEFSEKYEQAVKQAQRRYLCQECGFQNRTGARRCSNCGTQYEKRICTYCGAPIHFGQRCCAACGRLTTPPPGTPMHSSLEGLSVRHGRYTIQRVLRNNEDSDVVIAVARDTEANQQEVILKRWECTSAPPERLKQEIQHYVRGTEPLTRLRHPLVPQVLTRFGEGKYYYLIQAYIAGESLEEHMLKLLRPLPEAEVLGYMNMLLNILNTLDQQPLALRHYDISPSNILIESTRGRIFLTGFQVQPPQPPQQNGQYRHRTTRKLATSPYLPVKDMPYDQRTCIYALAATCHYALTNHPPPHYPAFPPVRLLNPAVSPGLEDILSRALMEDKTARYQSYAEMQKDLKRLL
ncbi:MAG TPA: protein kinase [Ktedonobacteraceae bacterium]|nr:protein kinase [Ktedonobacteraceae bacterium]